MIVVDTNVTAELMKPAPSPVVVGWVRGHNATELYTTSITLAEISYSIQRLPEFADPHSGRRAIDGRQ